MLGRGSDYMGSTVTFGGTPTPETQVPHIRARIAHIHTLVTPGGRKNWLLTEAD